MRAVLQAQINKTDRNDARGMAQMMRVLRLARETGGHQDRPLADCCDDDLSNTWKLFDERNEGADRD